jgi:hypothetical protein
MKLKPGMPVEVRRIRFGGFAFSGQLQEPVEVWERATFLRHENGHPVVQFKDGTTDILLSMSDVR